MPSAFLPSPTRRPWFTLALAGGVALLHLALWHGVADSLAAVAAPGRSPVAVQVRTVEPLAPPVEAPAPVAVARPAKPPRQASKPTAANAEPAPPPNEPEVHPVLVEAAVLVAAALPAQPAPEPTAAAALAADELPLYRTRIPPAMTLNYEMRRGALSGTGELQWRPTSGGYEAKLQGRMAGFNILTWASQGGFDAAGIAPVRYTDQRRNKAALAASFQREAGKISFSGASTEYPLLQGSQDRLSWMIQIAAIASADPKRLAPGARVAMYVVGARGDADVWWFQVRGPEAVATGETSVPAIKLIREPRKPHDTKVEVWLAPSLHHLPVRARLSGDGSALEFVLQSSQPAS